MKVKECGMTMDDWLFIEMKAGRPGKILSTSVFIIHYNDHPRAGTTKHESLIGKQEPLMNTDRKRKASVSIRVHLWFKKRQEAPI
jgi:hypothetical protein